LEFDRANHIRLQELNAKLLSGALKFDEKVEVNIVVRQGLVSYPAPPNFNY